MSSPVPRRRGRCSVRLFALTFLTMLLGLVGAPSAWADAPVRLPNQITDVVGALDGSTADVQSAIDDLYDAHRVRLWVVFVADFDNLDNEEWAQQTSALSDLGVNDVLMTVATVDRSYAIDVPQQLTSVTDQELTDLRTDAIEPALGQDDWAGAAIAAAGGLSDDIATDTTSTSSTGLWITVGVVVVIAVLVFLFLRRRRKAKLLAAVESAKSIDETDPAALATLPMEVLDERAKAILVETDNAIRTSADELETARGELGDAAAKPFLQALDGAKSALASAFTIRQRLDDAIPETPQQRRDMLTELVRSCAEADRRLDEQVDAFDNVRDLLIDAPNRLDALTRDQVALRVRIPESQTVLDALNARFPASTVAPVAHNVELASGQIAFAEENIDAGRTAAALPVGQQGPVVAAVRTAESALTQARTLLDAVDHAESDIANAIASLPAAMKDVQADIRTAEQLAAHGGAPLAAAKDAAAAALARAETSKDSDPLGSMNAIVAADSQLDSLLAAAAESKTQREHAAQRLAHDIDAAAAQVRAAGDFISTRRGAIGAEARTRLSEAERNLAAARQLATTDPSRALQHAGAATQYASSASQVAQSEVEQWDTRQRVQGGYQGRSMGSQAGGILAGVLIDSVLRGGLGGGRSYGNRGSGGFGGFGGGPGSFGGSSSSGRIGRTSGGRF
ncbi:membrane protein [Rhodococcoides trifolii]|uniref:Membrane protein n=1 Tax=Rhodococcoides trifolii TaxID=908250 RepID=A0A917CYZ5_9NOCA|nr:TPM domain-containing protein [Rhodococcus trifolii]GGG03043.1 membrane protein [Rhodococcus trifolii]